MLKLGSKIPCINHSKPQGSTVRVLMHSLLPIYLSAVICGSHDDPSPIGVPVFLGSCSPQAVSSYAGLLSSPSYVSDCHHYQKTPHLQNVTLLCSAVSQAHRKSLELIRTVVLLPTTVPPPLGVLVTSWLLLSLSSYPQPIVGIISWQTLFPSQHFGPSLCAPGSPSSLRELHCCLATALALAAVSVPPFQLSLPVLQYRRAVEFVLLRSLTLAS